MKTNVTLSILCLLLSVSIASAQDTAFCPAVAEVMAAVTQACSGTETGQACFGAIGVEAGLRDESLSFAQAGNIVSVAALDWLEATTMPDEAAWGVALLRLQADLPEGEEPVTALLVGSARIENATEADQAVPAVIQSNARVRSTPSTASDDNIVTTLNPGTRVTIVARDTANEWVQIVYGNGETGWMATFLMRIDGDISVLPVGEVEVNIVVVSPMQALNFARTTLGQSACADLPSGGLLLRAPETQVRLMMNGVTVAFDGTIFASLEGQATMPALRVEVYEGSAVVQSDMGVAFVVAGTHTSVALNNDLTAPANEPLMASSNVEGRDRLLLPLAAIIAAPDVPALAASVPTTEVEAAVAATFAPDGVMPGRYRLVNIVSQQLDGADGFACAGDAAVGDVQVFAPSAADAIESAYGVRIAAGVEINGASLNDHNAPQYHTLPEGSGEAIARTIIVHNPTSFTYFETWARRGGDTAASCYNDFRWEWIGA
ncbi:MAG: SH3 domain-containing protein [Chloroflexota bacterium]|nr:SH3 domain-containing protein [Chloroflexota bacterium]